MPVFEFEALDSSGEEVRDTIEAADEVEATAKIRSLGYFVTKLQSSMPVFEFEAMDSSGLEVRHTIEAADEAEATAKIRSLGYFVTKLRRAAAMSVCPACGEATRAEAERCGQCGAWLSSQGAGPVSQEAASAPEPQVSLKNDGFGDLENRVLSLLKQGRKIPAIKLCREESGVDLKTAKDFVEALAEKHGVEPSRSSGCAGLLLLLLLVIGVLLLLLAIGTLVAIWF